MKGTELNDQFVIRLIDLTVGEEAEVVGIHQGCRGLIRRRLLDLGLTPGAHVYVELQSAFGDPRAYRVRGTLLALRAEQAALVLVRHPGIETK